MSCAAQQRTLGFWHALLGFDVATAVIFWELFTTSFSALKTCLWWSPTFYGPYFPQLQEVHPLTTSFPSQGSCISASTSGCWPSPWHGQQTTRDRHCPSGGWAVREEVGRVLRAFLCGLMPQGPEWAGTLRWAHGRPNQQLKTLPTAARRGFGFCELTPCSFIASVASISSTHLVIQHLGLQEWTWGCLLIIGSF